MNDHSKIELIVKSIDEDFDLHDDEKICKASVCSMEELKAKLTYLIKHCIQQDFNHLVNVMYRIDVKEDEFKKAMEGQDLETIASDLADLVILREKQKVVTKQKYRS